MRQNIRNIIEKLSQFHNVSDNELLTLLTSEFSDDENKLLRQRADECRKKIYGTDVYIRGLIEFSNYCINNCYYCGIRRENQNVKRYRLSKDEIIECCIQGYELGFRTFVLQSGEDPYYTDDILCYIIADIRARFKDCAITLSIGERSKESYKAFFEVGANRYLLRHETASDSHYARLHPDELSLANRKKCLFDLKEIGYQVGAGFMVGSPYQTPEHLLADLRFLQELSPDMIGVGPFIHHADTPFANMPNGTLEMTLKLLSILRLLFPDVLLPATTALGTIHKNGRELGLKAGANVVMPNLSPSGVRENYTLYDNKICTGEETAACISCLSKRVQSAGYSLVTDIGNRRVI